jgi:hypothetical protein
MLCHEDSHTTVESKVNCSASCHRGIWGGRRYSSYSFLTSALDGVSGQHHAPVLFYPRERTPGTHWTGGWVGLGVSLDAGARRKISAPVGDRTPIIQPVVRHYTAWVTTAPLLKADTLKLVYFAYFHSVMSYGIIFWGNSTDSKRVSSKRKWWMISLQLYNIMSWKYLKGKLQKYFY